VKNLHLFTLGLCLLVAAALPARAAFSSLYVFGDALSATVDQYSPGPPDYYGQRDSNGRVWVEVLAQRQGLNFDITKNNDSYFDHNSAETLTDVNNFNPPADVTNDLFIVWVCNADTWDAADNQDDSNAWVSDNSLSQTNHLQIITKLYAKGVRTLILPNAVDISTVPQFNYLVQINVMHNGCVNYNVQFSNTINQARALCPGLTIYVPDFFTLLNNVLTNSAYYGLTNTLQNGLSIDAISDLYSNSTPVLNGPGTNYVFWDQTDPTAQFHAVIADVAQQIISPVKVGKIAPVSGSNRLDVVNYPAGLNGFVDGVTNLAQANWAAAASVASTNTAQSVFVPTSGPQQFYRLRFPYAWSWP